MVYAAEAESQENGSEEGQEAGGEEENGGSGKEDAGEDSGNDPEGRIRRRKWRRERL